VTPAEVVRAWFQAHARTDLEAARALVVEDLRIDMSGERMRGFDGFMAWYAQRRLREGPAFSYAVDDLLEGDDHAAAVLTLSAGERVWRQVAVYRVERDRITEIWAREDEPGPT
jgi:hypothetical protein